MSDQTRERRIIAISIVVLLQLLLSACYAILFAKSFLHFDGLAFMSLSEPALFWTFFLIVMLPLGSMAVLKYLPSSQSIWIIVELIGGTVAFYGGSVYNFDTVVRGLFFLMLGAISLVLCVWNVICLLGISDIPDKDKKK